MSGPDGLAIYLDSADVAAIDRGEGRPIATLQRCGATSALVLIQSIDGRQQSVERVRKVCGRLKAIDVAPILYSFPAVDGDLVEAARHYKACRIATKAPGQWDLEPRSKKVGDKLVVTHWTPSMLEPLLACDPDASVTSTRSELPHLGEHGRDVWLQLEAQTSTDTLEQALRHAPDSVLVTGLFDEKGDPRALSEVQRDLERCTEHARRIGQHAAWSLHTMSMSEADALREWALAVWGAAA